jgi:hypothetical protein
MPRVISEETRRKNKERSAAWRKKHPKYHQEYDKKYYKQTDKKERIYSFRKKNPGYNNQVMKAAYAADPEKFKEKTKGWKKLRKGILGEIKLHYGCQNPGCQSVGILPSCSLEFHHVSPRHKSFEISSGTSYPLVKILKEVNKCTVVCANCHSQVHGIGLNASKFKKCKVSKSGKIIPCPSHLQS